MLPTTLSPDQQALRATGITGSEIAALAGASRYKSAIDVYAAKVGQDDPGPDTSHHIERGVFLEDGLLRWYAWRTGRRVETPGTLRHPVHPLVIATPDAIAYSRGAPPRVVECKCPDWRAARDWGPDGTAEIPGYYMPQVQWELAVTECREADVVALIDGDLRIYTVPYMPDVFDALHTVAKIFWGQHVAARVPPAPEASAGYGEYLRRVFPEAVAPPLLDTPPAATAHLAAYHAATAAMLAAELRRDMAKHSLMAILQDAAGMQGDWGTLHYRNNKPSPKTDWRAVATAAGATPDMIAQHTSQPARGPRTFRAYITHPEHLPHVGSLTAASAPAPSLNAPARQSPAAGPPQAA